MESNDLNAVRVIKSNNCYVSQQKIENHEGSCVENNKQQVRESGKALTPRTCPRTLGVGAAAERLSSAKSTGCGEASFSQKIRGPGISPRLLVRRSFVLDTASYALVNLNH